MRIKVKRIARREKYTIGKLSINGAYFCDTLEDKDRDLNRDGDLNDPGEAKVQNETCIPAGTYKVIINESNRFKRLMPLLLNVPGFTGIRIHNGKNQDSTSGCLLVGKNSIVGGLTESKEIFENLFSLMLSAWNNKETIEIEIE